MSTVPQIDPVEETAAPVPQADRTDRWIAAGLLVATLFLFGWGIGSYPLWDPWEPKYAQAVREMQERGEWITPWLNDRIRWTKPILIYWAMYVPIGLFGNTEWTARLPSVLAAVLTVLCLWGCLRRLRGRATALIAAAVLATVPQFYFMARQAMPDMLLTLFLTATMGCFAVARFGRDVDKGRWMTGFYAALALAFLTKGPVGVVVTLCALAAFALLGYDPRRVFSWQAVRDDAKTLWRDNHVGRGLIVFAVVAAPWYVAMLAKHGMAFVDGFLVDENIRRFQGPLFGLEGASSYYLKTMLHGMYPWFGFLPLGLLFLFQGQRRLDEEGRQRWYWVSWFLAIFTIFTLAGTKLDHYVLPIAPVLAILVALVWEGFLARPATFWSRPVILLSLLFLLMTARDFVADGTRYVMDVFMPAQDILTDVHLELAMGLFVLVWTVTMALAFFGFPRVPGRWVLAAACLAAYGNGIYFSHYVIPAHAHERNLKAYAETFAKTSAPGAELIFYGSIRNSIIYYHSRHMRQYEPERLGEMVRYVSDRPNVYIIAQDLFFDEMLNELHRGTRVRWRLVDDDHPQFQLLTNADRDR